MDFWVRRKPGSKRHHGLISCGGKIFDCSLGRSGISTRKREGDGATPSGKFRLLYGFYRHDRLGILNSSLPLKQISSDMGWCDFSYHPAYNSLVKLPFEDSHEKMLRQDHLYDVCIVLDYNIDPRARELGSAIFFHLARPGFEATEGCVAVQPNVMRRLLPEISERSVMTIHSS